MLLTPCTVSRRAGSSVHQDNAEPLLAIVRGGVVALQSEELTPLVACLCNRAVPIGTSKAVVKTASSGHQASTKPIVECSMLLGRRCDRLEGKIVIFGASISTIICEGCPCLQQRMGSHFPRILQLCKRRSGSARNRPSTARSCLGQATERFKAQSAAKKRSTKGLAGGIAKRRYRPNESRVYAEIRFPNPGQPGYADVHTHP